jgi:hypothetical protein
MRSIPLVLGLFTATLTISATAGAEVTRIHEQSGDSQYFFDADGLVAEGYPSGSGMIDGRRRTARVLLIRPRVEFVRQLTKSVEQL